jgi:hypothetical protein
LVLARSPSQTISAGLGASGEEFLGGILGPAYPLDGKQPCLDALGQLHLLLGGKQGPP